MPSVVQITLLVFCKRVDAIFGKNRFELRAIDLTHLGPRPNATTNGVHPWLVARLPLVDECLPRNVDCFLLTKLSKILSDAGAPVHHGSESVEDNRFDTVHRHSFLAQRNGSTNSLRVRHSDRR